jgi:hypothetical protein
MRMFVAPAVFLCLLLLVVSISPALADQPIYHIFLTDGTDLYGTIVTNDSEGRRIQVMDRGQPDLRWISYHRVKAIVEEGTELDVTGKYILSMPLSTLPPTTHAEAPSQQPTPAVHQGMGSGTVIALSILGTIALLVLIGALAS